MKIRSKYKNSMTSVNNEIIRFDHNGIADVSDQIAFILNSRPGYEFVNPPDLTVKEVEVNGEKYYKYLNVLYPDYLNQGNAMSYIKAKALEHCKGKGIDIGASDWPIDGADPIQEGEEENAYHLPNHKDESLDFVFSSHCLEHLDKYKDALELWVSKLKVGGILFLYLPHKDMKLWNPGGPWVGEAHKWIPTFEQLKADFEELGLDFIEGNVSKDKYWSFHIVGKKVDYTVDPWNRVSDFPQ